jgi:hypothetical protein
MGPKSYRFLSNAPVVALLGFAIAAAFSPGCGSSTMNSNLPTTSGSGTVTTTISDPPVCASAFDSVYVTLTKVTAHISDSAGPNDAGWVTLVNPSAPIQIDLLHLKSSGECVLSQTLGSTNNLPPGKYQQIRLYLLDNGASASITNNCGSAGWNCVVPRGQAPQMLNLSSEAQTGIKIPSGRIDGGGIDIQAGKSADLNLDFDGCHSIIWQGNGKYRLVPTLHAGEVSLNTNSISGKVVDAGNSNSPVPGALVLLEQPDMNDAAIDRVQRAATTAADGTFIVCPLSSTNPFDIVVSAMLVNNLGATTTYNPTIAFNVPVGTDLSTPPIPLIPEATPPASPMPATVSGQVTSEGSNPVADVTLSLLQQGIPTGGAARQVTIPVFNSAQQPPVVTTTPTPTPSTPACPMNANCFNYSFLVPASNPQVGTFSGGSITYAAPAAPPVNYSLNGLAPSCTTSTPNPATIGPIVVTPNMETKVSTALAFSGCQ